MDLTDDWGQEDFSDLSYFSEKYVGPFGVSLNMRYASPLNFPAFLFFFWLASDGSGNDFQLNRMIQPSG